MQYYDANFYAMQREGSSRSATIVVPLLLNLLSSRPRSVVDLGCGVGTWLAAFKRNGVGDVMGLDGEYVDRAKLEIPVEAFRSTDLEQTIELDRGFDMAVSLEVAEHLRPERATGFVADIVKLAPVVAFSGAAPGQGGVNHVNEQWPSYWAALFARHGYQASDPLRREIWDQSDIVPCYRQNLIVFASQAAIEANPALRPARVGQLDIAHPMFVDQMISTENPVLLAKHAYWAWRRGRRS